MSIQPGVRVRNQTQTVPNQPRTPQRSVRVPDGVWIPAHQAAKRRGETGGLSAIMRDSLEAYNKFTDEQWADLEDVAADAGMGRAELFATAIMEWVELHR